MKKLQGPADIFLAIDVNSFFDLCQMFHMYYYHHHQWFENTPDHPRAKAVVNEWLAIFFVKI
jgi:hypothetical protein